MLVLFALQGVFYASTSTYGLPPDEKFHFESIQYYANKPITDGPFIDNQPPGTINDVNVIEDSAKYFYHYLLSFPARLMNGLSIAYDSQIMVFRLFSLVFSLATLLVFKRILDELSNNKILKNLSVAALTLSGIFVYLAGAINYDNLANLLFLAFILNIILLAKRPRPGQFIWGAVFGLATVITKYTFLPEVAIGILVATFIIIKKYGTDLSKYKGGFTETYSIHRAMMILGLIGLIIFSLLFVERIGGNIVRYGQVSPTCEKIFTTEQCYKNFAIYRRGQDKRVEFQQAGGIESSTDFNMFTQTGAWINKMYEGIYYYFGQHRIGSYSFSGYIAFILALGFIATLFLSRKKVNLRREHTLVIVLVLVYITLLYLMNLKTILATGGRDAYQGRYLLPVLGFIYFFAGLVIYATYQKINKNKNIFAGMWIALILLAAVLHLPPLIFYRYINDAKGTPYQVNRIFDIRYKVRDQIN